MNIEKYFKDYIQRHLGVVLLWSQYLTSLPLFELSWDFLSLPWANFLLGGCRFLTLKQDPVQDLCHHNYSHSKALEEMGPGCVGEVMPQNIS